MNTTISARLDVRLSAGTLDLPFLPATTSQILALCARDDVDMKVLAGVVGNDPTVAAHFLRLSNTAVFAARAKILSLNHAVARLGTNLVRQLVLLITCHGRAFHVRGRETMARGMLEHAVLTAIFAQEVARARGESGEEAFMCGLLHDIGSPVLLQLISDLEVETGVAIDDETVEHQIQRLHEGVGFQIASQWSTSPDVCEAVGSHHRILSPHDRSPAALAVATLQLAEWLAEGVATEVIAAHPAVALLSLDLEQIADIEKARAGAREIIDNLP